MSSQIFDLADTITMLRRTPAVLTALLADLPDAWIHATDGEGEWSAYQVMEHMITAERTNWIPRAQHILTGETRPFPPFERLPASNHKPSMAELLATFAELREQNVATLIGMNLSADDLQRTGIHPEFGEVMLEKLLATWVVHDLSHGAQITRTLARIYKDAVGPWRAYLAILDA